MKIKPSREILAALEAPDDGLRTRGVGIWSLEKLAILHLYFQAFTSASAKASGGVYVDGLAGPGACSLRGAIARPFRVWGSPMLALKAEPSFQKCIFVEINTANARALGQRISAFGERATVLEGDVNSLLPDIIGNRVHRLAPCFCLLDPEGMELNWSTIQAAATTPNRRRMPEFLILFPSSWLLRLLPRGGSISGRHVEILDRVMPSQEWREIYHERLRDQIAPATAKEQYVELYRQGLEALGYKAFSHVIQAPSRPGQVRRERYRLIFATQHEAGEQIMSDVFRRPYVLDFPVSSQPTLFE